MVIQVDFFYNLAVIFNVSWEEVSTVPTYSTVLTRIQNLFLFHCFEHVLLAGGQRGAGIILLQERNFSPEKENSSADKKQHQKTQILKIIDSRPK